jgi:MinD-like ATPase involved in chromosome partitioning or flagellar assembly
MLSFLSFKGSPGVTTTVAGVAASWPRPAIAVDLDPQGGDMLVGLGGGRVSAAGGILDVLAEARLGDLRGPLGRHALRPAKHGPLILAGFGSPQAAAAVDWPRTAEQLGSVDGVDLLVDCGRLNPTHPMTAVLAYSAAILIVTRSHLAAVRHVARAVPLLPRTMASPRLVVVGPDRPYSADEISRACGLPLAAVLPDDPGGACHWTDGAEPGPRFHRGKLQQAMLVTASGLAAADHAGRSA